MVLNFLAWGLGMNSGPLEEEQVVSAAAFSPASCRSFNSILIYFVHMCAAVGIWRSEDNLTKVFSYFLSSRDQTI